MILGFDLQPLVRGASGGIVQWLAGIVRAYATAFPDDRILLFEPEDFSFDLPQYPSVERIRAPRNELHAVEAEILRSRSADALVRSYPDVSHPAFPMERQIVVVPDLQHAERPDFFAPATLRARRLAFGRLLSQAGAVATMTEFSRKSILRYPWTACGDVFLMPPALDAAFAQMAGDRAAAGPGPAALGGLSRFFFMPANPWPHKNHRCLFEAFARATPHLPPGTALVLTGAGDGWAQLLSGYETLPIRHLGYLPRAEVAEVYRRSLALAFFSLYEGFGMPLLEAFHFGTPVVCSNIPPLIEVGGDAVLSCSPADPAAMADLLVRIATSTQTREDLIHRGRERLANFSWERSAGALRAAVLRIAERSAGPLQRKSKFGGRFSIIIDAALGGAIRPAVAAVCRQSHDNWELMILGDPPALEAGRGDPRVRLIVTNETNCGRRAASALAQATGEARIYLRPDCILCADALARLATAFGDDAPCDIVAASTTAVAPSGAALARWEVALDPTDHPPPGLMDRTTFAFERSLIAHLGGDFRSTRPLVAWRRRIEATGVSFDPCAGLIADGDLWLRLLEAGGNLAVIPEPLARIELHSDFTAARLWYKVMRDYASVAERRGIRLDSKFYRLLSHRRFGFEPALDGSGRRLLTALGRGHYRLRRLRPKLRAFVNRCHFRLRGRSP